MNKLWITSLAFVLLACTDFGADPADRDFNILLKFGVGARNELDTFHNKYTKDLILDGAITVSLALSTNDFDAIKEQLDRWGFYSYPDTLKVEIKDPYDVAHDPHSTYYIRVKRGSTIKTLYWDDAVVPFHFDQRRQNLYYIITFIQNLVNQKPEVLNLPPARGAYL